MFREVTLQEAILDPFMLYKDNWGLITAGKSGDFNMMTVSWGSFGELWGRDIATVYVRGDRYTYEFTEREERFTLSFFDPAYHGILERLGRESGRDADKMNGFGLTAAEIGCSIGYEEAWLTIACKKIYAHTFDKAEFCDESVDRAIYSAAPYHKMYIGEIEHIYVKE